MKYPVDNVVVYDLEVFPTWFLAGFEMPDGRVFQYVNDAQKIRDMLAWAEAAGYPIAGFNSSGYDDLVLTAFLRTEDPATAYKTSVDIIVNQVPRWKFDNDINSIDLMPVLPGRMSLKKIGVCLGHSRLQELPVPFDRPPSPEEQEILLGYNGNDLVITRKLHQQIKPELDLRARMSEQYGIDLRSKGEATLAEMILLHEYERRGGVGTKKDLNNQARQLIELAPYVYVRKPTWWEGLVSPETMPELAAFGEEIFTTRIPIINDRLSGAAIDRSLYLDDRYYSIGVGGLHSVDGPGAWVPGPGQMLIDIDVASYYPNGILTQKLYPRPWGPAFLDIYQDIVNRRMAAKRAGDKTTADVLKIAANGTYGKSSDPYSALYDPDLTANVTVVGQLALLVLIKMFEGVATVVSANTDGITVMLDTPRLEIMKSVVAHWERATGFDMEYTEYRALYQRDVNNYLALKTDGGVKQKGIFIDQWPDLRHTPSANIIATAVTQSLAKGIPVRNTIRECPDINQFVLTQNVTGNWTTEWNWVRLGKVLRFYKSNRADAAPIIRSPGEGDKGNRGNVPLSEGCVPLEDLPETLPRDINYAWYVKTAEDLLAAVKAPKRPGMNRWAEVMHRAGLRPCMVDPSKVRSRARVEWGTEDFTSMPAGHVLGTGTGDGLIARVWLSGEVDILAADRHYPTRTRAKVSKDEGFDLTYGARVVADLHRYTVHPPVDFDQFYTPAELRKVGR